MWFKKKNKKNEIVRWGMAAGFLECVYVFLVILVLNVLGPAANEKFKDPFQSGLFMLLFFVFSVLISGLLVLGKPAVLLLDKKITDAISVFFVTLVTIFVIFVLVGIIIFA